MEEIENQTKDANSVGSSDLLGSEVYLLTGESAYQKGVVILGAFLSKRDAELKAEFYESEKEEWEEADREESSFPYPYGWQSDEYTVKSITLA